MKGAFMPDERTICVVCAWRQTCNKKFSMDGATTTRCLDYTRDVTLTTPAPDETTQGADSASRADEGGRER
jgi:hypothetical protein